MRNAFNTFILSCLISFSYAQPAVFNGMTTDTLKISMGDLNISLVKYTYGAVNFQFIALHDNEDTGVRAAFEFVKKNGGSIIDSQYGNGRNFKFMLDDEDHQVDPNSIYTRPGIFSGLNKYSGWQQSAATALEKTSKTILDFYNPEKAGYIIALHNNTDSAFSINDYLIGGNLESAATSVHINPEMDADDFILVTRQPHYDYLKSRNVNVVLQSPEAPNDGSLSIYAMYMNIPYFNVEVQHGHQEENLRLIEIVANLIKEENPPAREK